MCVLFVFTHVRTLAYMYVNEYVSPFCMFLGDIYQSIFDQCPMFYLSSFVGFLFLNTHIQMLTCIYICIPISSSSVPMLAVFAVIAVKVLTLLPVFLMLNNLYFYRSEQNLYKNICNIYFFF